MATGEVVHTFTTEFDPASSQYDRMLMGLMRNMDLESFYVDEVKVDG